MGFLWSVPGCTLRVGPAGRLNEELVSRHVSTQGGNDFEIFDSPKTIGHTVTAPKDTIAQCKEIFMTKA